MSQLASPSRHADAAGPDRRRFTAESASQQRQPPAARVHAGARSGMPPSRVPASTLQRSGTAAAGRRPPSRLVAAAVASPGRGLDGPTRSFMESRLGADLGAVRIHTGAVAAESARALGASAYTVGRDVVFGDGQWSSATSAGRQALAHELVHVLQQRAGPVPGGPIGDGMRVSDPADRLEREAERVAGGVATPGATAVRLPPAAGARVGGPTVQRHPLPTKDSEWEPPPGTARMPAAPAPAAPGAPAPPIVTATLPGTTTGPGGPAGAPAAPAPAAPAPAGGPAPAPAGGPVPAPAGGPAPAPAGGPAPAPAGGPPPAPAPAPVAPTELTSPSSYAAYAALAAPIRRNWAALGSADARGTALGGAAGQVLTSVNVMRPAIAMADLPAGNGGKFQFANWTLTLARASFAPAAVTDASFEGPYTDVYHEARHCEQWYRMARLRAGAGRTAPQIASEMGMDPAAADSALGWPLHPASPEAAEAQVWWNSVYGTGSAARAATLNELMAALQAYNAATATYTAAPTPANYTAMMAAYTRLQTANTAYHALPEEADAFSTAGPARAALTAALAAPPAAPPGRSP